jgi:NADH:ubiquinone oxidoreductase subunit K
MLYDAAAELSVLLNFALNHILECLFDEFSFTPRCFLLLSGLIAAFLACLIGIIIDRHMLLKFFLCYETLFFTVAVVLLAYSGDVNAVVLVFYLLFCSTFEVIIGLSILLISSYSSPSNHR